jgi:hypothetical protein
MLGSDLRLLLLILLLLLLLLLLTLLLFDVRVKSTAEALVAALGLDRRQALVMLGSDLSLLDTPPLRIKQQLEALQQLMQVRPRCKLAHCLVLSHFRHAAYNTYAC